MKKKFQLLLLLTAATAAHIQAQTPDTLYVAEHYVRAPLLRVLGDFRTKYGMTLKYDSVEMAPYTFEHIYFGDPVNKAFDEIFKQIKNIAYFVDDEGITCVVLKKNVPRNRTTRENKRYEGEASRTNFTITGRIKDQTNGEPLPFATVQVEGTTIGASSNDDGYFTLYNVPSDREVLIFRYLGYETQRFYLSPQVNMENLFVELPPSSHALDEVVVVAQREDVLKIPEHSIGVIQTTAAKIADLPALGEKDLFRTFHLMPGISASNESSAGMYVRGGTPDQNLVLYDGFTIYHQEHLMGVFSAFNTNAIKDVQLHKGGFDAKHGGRLSSVMEIIGRTGNDKHFNIGGDVGFLGFNAFAEMPFKNEKGAIFIAGRRSFQSFMYDKFTDVYTNNQQSGMGGMTGGRGGPGGGFNMRNSQKPESYFYDLNAKLTYNPTKRDIFSLSFFNGEDVLDNSREGFGSQSISGSITDKTNWGNTGLSAKWSRKWDNKLYTNALVSFSNYYSLRDRQNSTTTTGRAAVMFDQNTDEHNNLKDYSLKIDNEYKINGNNKVEFGLNFSNYNINYRYAQSDTINYLNMKNKGNLLSLYLQDKYTLADRLTLLPGLRFNYYDVTSRPYFEPRFQAFYKVGEYINLKGSAGYYYQFVNRIVREDISAGSRDIWLLSDDKSIPVSGSLHTVLGGSYETRGFIFDVEAYYKRMNHLSEYTLRFAPSLSDNSGYQEFFYNGEGYARGIDFLLQKKYGKLTGWIAYTLAESRYHFPVYGDGYFASNQDVTHEFKTVITYKPVRNLTLSATWIYATGKPFTEPVGAYTLTTPNSGSMNFIIVDKKNNARYPDYHRMDLLAKYDLTFIRAFNSSISVSLFNLYDRANVWYREYAFDQTYGITATNINLLGFTPNVTLSIQLK